MPLNPDTQANREPAGVIHDLLTAARTGAAGGTEPAKHLTAVLYEELRRLAAGRRLGAVGMGTLQPTALVNEAYLRLLGDHNVSWEDRREFFAAAAVAMRDILVERARRKARVKHGGGRRRVELDGLGSDSPLAPGADEVDVVEVDRALTWLAGRNPRRAEVVMLRYFAGLSIEHTGLAMGISEATVKREWALAKAELYERLSAAVGGGGA